GTNAADFGQTSNCVTTLAPQANCTVSITFSSTGGGTRTATLSVTDDAASSPQTLALTGTGTLLVTASVNSLTFSNTGLGQTSASLPVTVKNQQSVPATVSSAATSAGFIVTGNTCTTLAAGATCVINVAFNPTTLGALTGTLTINHDAPGSPLVVSLSGSGVASLTFHPSPITVTGSVVVGTTSRTGYLIIQGTNLTIQNISVTGSGFSQINNCSEQLQPLYPACGVNIIFTPQQPGSYTGSLNFTYGSPGVPVSVPITATAVAETPVGIYVTPINPQAAVGTTVQLSAIATMASGAMQDVTAQTTWTSSVPNTITVSGTGMGTANAAGASTITAAYSGLTATASLQVYNHVIIWPRVTSISPWQTV